MPNSRDDAGADAASAPPLSAYLFLISGMAVVGAYVGFSKVIVATVPVFLLATIRFGIAIVVMLPWTYPQGGLAQARAHRGTLIAESVFGNFLFSICMLSGVARTSATAAGLIMSMLPAAVALVSLIALRERLDRRTSLAVMLAVVGVGSLTIGRSGAASNPDSQVFGNAAMVGAVLCEALYVVVGKRLTNAGIGPMRISAWINIVGFVLMLPFGLWQARHYDFALVTPAIWGLIVIYAIAASVLSTWLWLSGLRHVPASRAGIFTTALPITSALVGIAFLGERPTPAHGIAFVCAVAGIVLVTRIRRPVRSRAPVPACTASDRPPSRSAS